MSRWIEFRINKSIDDVIVKGSLRATINGLSFKMNDPIDGISYRAPHIPTFTLPYRRYIDEGNLSDYGKSESEELMIKAYSFSQFIQNNGEYTKQLYDSFNRELKLLESKFCNVSVFKEEKSKAKRLLKAGLITPHHYQNVILKKLTREHKTYIDKVQELRNKHNYTLANKLGHYPTNSFEDLENLLGYYRN